MNTYGDIGNATAGWLFMRLLARALTVQVYEQFAMQATIPQNQTRVAQFQRLVPFPAATTPLTEGVPPDPDEITYETVSRVVQSYGSWFKITDQVDYHSKQNVLGHGVDLQGDQIALTFEKIYHDVLTHGTNVQYGGKQTARTNLDDSDALSHTDLRAAERLLAAQKAKHVTEILGPGPNYETWSVDAAYVAICHTDLYSNTLVDIASTKNAAQDGFKKVADYGTREPISPHEKGTYSELRFICSQEASPWRGAGATAAAGKQALWQNSAKPSAPSQKGFDVYPIVCFGQEAYGGIALRGKSAVLPFVKNPDNSHSGDPLGQVGYASWKVPAFAALILNQNWHRRIEVPAAL